MREFFATTPRACPGWPPATPISIPASLAALLVAGLRLVTQFDDQGQAMPGYTGS